MGWRHFSLGIWQNPQIFWDLHLYFTFSIDNRQDTALGCRGAPLRAAAGQLGKLWQSWGELSTTRIYDDKALYCEAVPESPFVSIICVSEELL